MRNTHANSGSTSIPIEQTGERIWSWDVRDGVAFRRLSTLFGCVSSQADGFEVEFFSAGGVHPDYPLMLVDDQRVDRRDAWTGITWFRVDYLGTTDDVIRTGAESGLFTPQVTVSRERREGQASIVGDGRYIPVTTPGVIVDQTYYLPRLQIVHVHRDEREQASYGAYLTPPRIPHDLQTTFYNSRLFVQLSRTKIRIGSYWQYNDVFYPLEGFNIAYYDSIPVIRSISFEGCTSDDTFQDRLDSLGTILADYIIAQIPD